MCLPSGTTLSAWDLLCIGTPLSSYLPFLTHQLLAAAARLAPGTLLYIFSCTLYRGASRLHANWHLHKKGSVFQCCQGAPIHNYRYSVTTNSPRFKTGRLIIQIGRWPPSLCCTISGVASLARCYSQLCSYALPPSIPSQVSEQLRTFLLLHANLDWVPMVMIPAASNSQRRTYVNWLMSLQTDRGCRVACDHSLPSWISGENSSRHESTTVCRCPSVDRDRYRI